MVSPILFVWFADFGKISYHYLSVVPTGLFGQMVGTLSVPFDLQPNFRIFLPNGKHAISLRVRLHRALFIVVSDPFTRGKMHLVSVIPPRKTSHGKYLWIRQNITQSTHNIKCGDVLMSKV